MSWDPFDHMDDAERTDFEVRQHLYAQRRLAELEKGTDSKERVRRMLDAVTPGPKVCGHVGSRIDGKPGKVCGKPGARMVGITGTWVCAEHDPLDRPAPPVCCVRAELNDGRPVIHTCDAKQGVWGCVAGIAGHGWPHRFMRLENTEGDSE